MGMAAALHGAKFTGTKRLKLKESDRGTVMAQELAKFGIQVDVNENDIVVYKGEISEPKLTLVSHNDHRVAMTLAALCTITGGEIDGAEAVKKSFPQYFEVLKQLGVRLEEDRYEL
jgi:3-phosphoshikimate 1-carboxyvinyltransferase